ncbi:hypothetical protein [Desulfofundulus sp.]|uniref:hypothetical protein n=1 Tax=Desulfofundulus sp. TaxID=2282750 RepID=UPI003C72396D
MDETLKELEVLAAKFKDKKKLNSTDSEIAREKLRLLLESPEYYSRACRLIAILPVDCCQAVLDAWKESSCEQKEKIIQVLLDEPELNGSAGFYRKIKLVATFIPDDYWVALRLLINLSGFLTDGGTKSPGKLFVRLFRKELIETRKLLEIPLEKYDISVRQISGIAAMVLSGMQDEQGSDIAMKTDCINWLGRCRCKADLGAKLVAEIENITKKWPEDLQRQCHKLGLIKTISYSVRTEKHVFTELGEKASHRLVHLEKIKEKLPPGHDASPGSSSDMQKTTAGTCVELNVQTCIDWLTQYIATLEKENASLKGKLNSLEIECQREKMRNKEQEKQLTNLLEVQNQRETLIQELNRQITGLENEKQELLNTLQEESYARKKEVESLKNRIELECNYVLEEFRNRLMDRLSRHYRGYLEAIEKPPTIQLAEYLKFLLDRVFRELINQGVRLNGDE